VIRVNTFDLLYLNGSMQHKELLLIAERKRSVRAAHKKSQIKTTMVPGSFLGCAVVYLKGIKQRKLLGPKLQISPFRI